MDSAVKGAHDLPEAALATSGCVAWGQADYALLITLVTMQQGQRWKSPKLTLKNLMLNSSR